MSTNITNTYPVSGMSCASCAGSVEKTLLGLAGVSRAQVNFASSSVLVEYDPELINENSLKENVSSAGFELFMASESEAATDKFEESKDKELVLLQQHTLLAFLLTAPVMVVGMFYPNMPYANEIMWLLSTPVLFIFGKKFFVNAYKKMLQKKANMDTLVAVSTSVAYFFSIFNTLNPEYWLAQGLEAHVYFEAAAVIICFILLGKLLEEKAKSSTSSAIKGLMGLQVKKLMIVNENGEEQEIAIENVKKGDLIRVRPGEKIPVDGVVISGSSYIDESMISGEAEAAQIKVGKTVFAGTLNQKGSFIFKAVKVGSQTVLSQIIKMVQEAQGSKAPVQKLVDKIAGIFVPLVLVFSVVTFVAWIILGGENAFSHGLLASVTVLIIACPCALGLATPTAIMVGIGKGAENNILIKDAESLELAHRVNAIVLDKTGTITEGRPVVTDYNWEKESEESTAQFESILLSMEIHSEHPLAAAIVDKLDEKKVVKAEILNFESVTGMGVTCTEGDDTFIVGNEAILKEYGINFPSRLKMNQEELQSLGKTVVYFAGRGEVIATIAITDAIKPTSIKAISTLQEQGIEVYMLTGDHPKTAKIIAEQVNIKNVEAGLMPTEKSDYVKKLQEKGLIVAMVGDGINDSQALAQADVSIAMGKGSDIAMDVAQMTLITSDLNVIPKSLELSRQTVRTIKENLFWAFIYNLIGIPLAAGVLYAYNGFLLSPMIAAAAMGFSSVSVVLNSVRLKWQKLV